MTEPISNPRYWAFISYSHADARWAQWLHRAIETWRVPWRLVGSAHPDGPLPRRLFPVFRDRDELSSSHELGGAIRSALEASRYLIVICSPRSARSRWVNEEVRYFKSLGRENRVLALIVDGEPGDARLECFCPAMTCEVAADGSLRPEQMVEPIAADVRAGGDSRRVAKLRLLAGMLGVGFDALQRREQRRLLWRVLTGSAVGAALMASVLSAWQWRETRIAAEARQAQAQRLVALGRQELEAGASGRAAAALVRALELGGDGPQLRVPLRQAMASGDALLRRLELGRPARRVTLSPDGRRVAALGLGDRLVAWEVDTGTMLFEAELDREGGNHFEKPLFSPDGRYLYSTGLEHGGEQLALVVVDLQMAEQVIRTRVAASNPAWSQQVFSPDSRQLIYINADKRAQIITLDGTAPARILPLPERAQRVAVFSPDGRYAAIGAGVGEVALWSLEQGTVLRRFEGLSDLVNVLAFSRDGHYLAAGAAYGAIRVWEVDSGELHTAAGQRFTIEGLQFSADGSRYLSLADDGVRVWDNRNGALVLAPAQPRPKNKWPALHPDGNAMVLTDAERATLWDTTSGHRLGDFDIHSGGAFDADFSADGQRVAIAGADGGISVWRHGVLPRATHVHGEALQRKEGTAAMHASYSPDGQWQASGGSDGRVEVRSAQDQTLLHELTDHERTVVAALWSPDSRRLLTVQDHGVLQDFDAQTGARLHLIDLDQVIGNWFSVRRSPDGRSALVASEGPELPARLIDLDRAVIRELLPVTSPLAMEFVPTSDAVILASGTTVTRLDLAFGDAVWTWDVPADGDEPFNVTTLTVSPDGQRVFVGVSDGRLRALDAHRGAALPGVEATLPIVSIASQVAPDGWTTAWSAGDASVFLWDARNGQTRTLTGHTDFAHSLHFTPDSGMLLSAGFDSTARLWSVTDGAAISTFRVHAAGINHATLSADGQRLITASADNRVAVLDISAETRPLAELRQRLRCTTIWAALNDTLVAQAQAPCAPAQP